MTVTRLLGASGIMAEISGNNGSRSVMSFDGAFNAMTAILNFERFCWSSWQPSCVRKTSNFCTVNARSLPFLMEAQPSRGTVETTWPVRKFPSRLGRHSSSKTRISRHSHQIPPLFFWVGIEQLTPCRLNRSDCLCPFHRGKIVQELRQRMPTFEIIKQRRDRHARPTEARRATHPL